MRKQLERDVETLSGAGIWAQVRPVAEGHTLPVVGFSPLEVGLPSEERAVQVDALRNVQYLV